jgi:hypothetical protein
LQQKYLEEKMKNILHVRQLPAVFGDNVEEHQSAALYFQSRFLGFVIFSLNVF